MYSESEEESTFEVKKWTKDKNYTAFSSRGLLDMIGDLNDKARQKQAG